MAGNAPRSKGNAGLSEAEQRQSDAKLSHAKLGKGTARQRKAWQRQGAARHGQALPGYAKAERCSVVHRCIAMLRKAKGSENMECKILIGQKSICDHLRIGKRTFYLLLKAGAPIMKGPAGWQTHIDLLEDYFKQEIEHEFDRPRRFLANGKSNK